MRLSIISSAALLGVSLAVSPDPGVTATEEAQTAYITVHPDACQAPGSRGPEFILPATASPSASPEADLSTLTITSTSTHVVWVTEDKKTDEPVFETDPPRPSMSYAPFTPPVAPLSCDDAPVLTYISETVWETLPASTVTTTSVSTTTLMVDHERNLTSTVYVTLSQTPVTVTATATITAAPSLVTVTVTDKYTAQGPSDQTNATVIMTTANSTQTMNGTSMASATFQGTSTSVNVVPVDSTPVPTTPTRSAITPSMLRSTAPASSSPVFIPAPPMNPATSTPVTTQSRPSSYLPTSPNFFTSHPMSSIVSGVVPSNPVLSTGWSSSTALRPSGTISSIMTAPTETPTSAPCVATKNITLDFDNLPVAVHNRESPSIPSPYQHFFFSKGWIYGTAATVTYAQFPASSGNSMAAYIPSLSPNGSAPGSFGIFTNDTEIAHGFNIHSLRFGCNGLGASRNEICRVLVTGIPVDAHVKRHAIEVDIEPCMFADGCALAIIDFGENMFPALKAMQFRASIANKTVGWFIDDIEMGLNVKCANETGNAESSLNYGNSRPGVVRRRSVAYEPFKSVRKNRK